MALRGWSVLRWETKIRFNLEPCRCMEVNVWLYTLTTRLRRKLHNYCAWENVVRGRCVCLHHLSIAKRLNFQQANWHLWRKKKKYWSVQDGVCHVSQLRFCSAAKYDCSRMIDLFNLRLPKPTSFPTRCHVWEASVMNQSKPEKAGSNGLWKHIISKIWIGSTGSRWSSSGKNFHVSLHCGILDEIQKMMTESKCEPELFKGRIIFMSMYNDIEWVRTRPQRKLYCEFCQKKKTEYSRRFPQGRWSFLVLGSEKKWYGTHHHKPHGEWDKTAEGMMLNFADSGHPVFRATGALERGELKKKREGKKSVHVNRISYW